MRACQVGGVLCAGDSRQAMLSATLLRWLYLLFLTIREARLGALPFIACQEEGVGYINDYLFSKALCACARSSRVALALAV